MHKFALGKRVAKLRKLESESRARWQMPHLPPYLQPRSVFWYANVAFTIFASDLHLSFYICTTYLQGANLKSFFFFVQSLVGQMRCKPYQSFSSHNCFLLRIWAQVDLFLSKGFFLGEVIMFISPFKIFAFSNNRIKKKRMSNRPSSEHYDLQQKISYFV